MKKLQVKINGIWEFVFCRNWKKRDPITTKDKSKALTVNALEYFKEKFGNHEFRVGE